MQNLFSRFPQLAGHFIRHHSAIRPAAQYVRPFLLVSLQKLNVFCRKIFHTLYQLVLMENIVGLKTAHAAAGPQKL